MSVGLALSLAVGSSLCWAILDALRKRLAGDMPSALLVAVFSLGQVPIFGAWWFAQGGGMASSPYWLPGLAGLVLNLAANLLFVMAVKRSALSVTIPFLAFTPVFTALIAAPLLDQVPNTLEGIGIGIVVVGGLVFGLAKDQGERSLFREPGVWMMLGVAAMWASTTALDKAATDHAPAAFHGLVQTGGVGLAVGLYLLVREGPSTFKAAWPQRRNLAFAIAFAAAAFGLQLLALRGLDAAHVETQKRVIGLVMALAIGRAVFSEAITRRKIFGVAVLAAGTLVVAWGASANF